LGQMGSVQQEFRTNSDQEFDQLVSSREHLEARKLELTKQQEIFNEDIAAKQADLTAQHGKLKSSREECRTQAQSGFQMIVKGLTDIISARNTHQQTVAQGLQLQQHQQNLDQHKLDAQNHFKAIDEALQTQLETIKDEAHTIDAIQKWIPEAFDSVQATLQNSMTEAKDEVPQAAALIKGLHKAAFDAQQRLDDRYLKLARMSDNEVGSFNLKIQAKQDSFNGGHEVEDGVLSTLESNMSDLQATNISLKSAYDLNATQGERLVDLKAQYSAQFGQKYGPLEELDDKAQFEVHGCVQKLRVADIFFTMDPQDPQYRWAEERMAIQDAERRALQDENAQR